MIDPELPELSEPRQDPGRAAEIQRRAREAFIATRSPLARLRHLIGLGDRPAVVVLGVIYLILAVQAVNSLYR
jgi:hypothetical protein